MRLIKYKIISKKKIYSNIDFFLKCSQSHPKFMRDAFEIA